MYKETELWTITFKRKWEIPVKNSPLWPKHNYHDTCPPTVRSFSPVHFFLKIESYVGIFIYSYSIFFLVSLMVEVSRALFFPIQKPYNIRILPYIFWYQREIPELWQWRRLGEILHHGVGQERRAGQCGGDRLVISV